MYGRQSSSNSNADQELYWLVLVIRSVTESVYYCRSQDTSWPLVVLLFFVASASMLGDFEYVLV